MCVCVHTYVSTYVPVCVTYLWVGFDSRRPYEWLMSMMSHPQPPCSAPVDSCLWVLLWNQYISYLVFSCCLLIFPALLAFSKNLCSTDVPEAVAISTESSKMLKTHSFSELAVTGRDTQKPIIIIILYNVMNATFELYTHYNSGRKKRVISYIWMS